MKTNLWTLGSAWAFGLVLAAGCADGAVEEIASIEVEALPEAEGLSVTVLDHATMEPVGRVDVTLAVPGGAAIDTATTGQDGRAALGRDARAAFPHLELFRAAYVDASVFTGAAGPADLDDRTVPAMSTGEWLLLHDAYGFEPAAGTGLVIVRVTHDDGAPVSEPALRLYSDGPERAPAKAPYGRGDAWLARSDEWALFNVPAGPNTVTAEALGGGAPPLALDWAELAATVRFEVRAGEVTFVEVTLPTAP